MKIKQDMTLGEYFLGTYNYCITFFETMLKKS
jgi:hypothetical protein